MHPTSTAQLAHGDAPEAGADLSTQARRALQLIGASLALGVAGDALLRVGPWGLNVAIWLAGLLAVTAGVMSADRQRLNRSAVWLGVAAWVGACAMAWRDSLALKALNFATLCGALAMAAASARGERWLWGGLTDYVWRGAQAVVGTLAGYIPTFLGRSWWTPQATAGWGRRARSITIGGLLALPLLLVFGALLASADAVFRGLLQRIFDFNLPEIISHVVPIAACAWAVAGWLSLRVFRNPILERELRLPQFVSLGSLEIGVALGLVNALFVGFILVQVRYLFGGAQLVQVTPGLTYAEYARHGFFELVAVVTLALPMLLSADWLLAGHSRRGFRWQAALMVAMLGVILGSAWQRMRLYQSEYGWTELRFYVTAFMVWLAAILGWFAATVLTGRRERFIGGAVLAAAAWVLGLNAWNPDASIASKNFAHARAGHAFDVRYALGLSADATPVLLAGLDTLPHDKQDALRSGLAVRMPREMDWRIWSWSRWQAGRQLRAAGIEPDPEGPADH